jgi:hypothetical protein
MPAAKPAPADERSTEPREPTAGQSARFRIRVDRLGRVIPEIDIVADDDASAAVEPPANR